MRTASTLTAIRSGLLGGALALVLAACASEPPATASRPHHRPGGWAGEGGESGREGGSRGLSLFISPSGEPFRGPASAPYPVAAWFAQADLNHDGRLDRAEFRADALRFFHLLDRNGDGIVDGSEVSLYEREVAPEILGGPRAEPEAQPPSEDPSGIGAAQPADGQARLIRAAYQDGLPGGGGGGPGGGGGGFGGRSGHGRGGERGRGGGGRPEGHAGVAGAAFYGLLNEPEPVASADLRFNGRITPEEFSRVADHRFDLLDTRKQEFLTLAELPPTPFQRALEARDRDRAGRR